MTPQIIQIEEQKFLGIKQCMTFSDFNVESLWRTFIPRLGEINGRIDANRISAAVYGKSFFDTFNPFEPFEKWAAVVVEEVNVDALPQDMEVLTIPAGLYAVFHYKGSGSDSSIFGYIFSEWLPKSEYKLDSRPHFEVLGDRYRNNDTTSEEDIWIPVCYK